MGLPGCYCCFLSQGAGGRLPLIPEPLGPEGCVFRTLDRPSHHMVFVTEASQMELVSGSRRRGYKDLEQQVIECRLHHFLAEYLSVSSLTLSAQFPQ